MLKEQYIDSIPLSKNKLKNISKKEKINKKKENGNKKLLFNLFKEIKFN